MSKQETKYNSLFTFIVAGGCVKVRMSRPRSTNVFALAFLERRALRGQACILEQLNLLAFCSHIRMDPFSDNIT